MRGTTGTTRRTRAPHRRWRWVAAASAALLAALSVAGAPAAASDRGPAAGRAPAQAGAPGGPGTPAGPPDVLPPGGRWTVTLVTGEVVDVAADGEGRVTAQVRRHDGPYQTLRQPDGELYVIPRSVAPLLGGVLDREVFNVTGLVRQGYHDDGRADIPLIVQRTGQADVAARTASASERSLPSIGAVAVEVPKANTAPAEDLLADLAAGGAARRAAGVTRIWLDRQVTLSRDAGATTPGRAAAPRPAARGAARAQAPELDPNLTQIGADDAWAAGYTGDGAVVAVLDTGADPTHPDLAGRIDVQENFSDAEDALDHHGHGTHVAALAAGTGAGSGGARRGVAPDARLLVGKVVDDGGYGQESQAIAGMEWAAPQADVVNMSLGYGGGSDGSDPISAALDALSEQHGTLFVVAAGNSGPGSRSVEFPGVADRALTVGAVDTADALADFSSRGPTPGSWELKPEVVAPGVDVVSARAAGTTMGDPVGEHYITASGTSMAAPHVAGAAAVLVQRHPDWDATQLKGALVGAADGLDDDTYDVGAGLLDVGEAVTATVRPGQDAIEADLPHPRAEPHTQQLTWANDGTEPVTVALEAALEDREGEPVDEVAIEPAELTIAPGATGTATLTVDAPELDAALYGGVVTATVADGDGGDGDTGDGDDDGTRTPVALHAGAEMFDLTVNATPPAGADPAASSTILSVVNLDDFGVFDLYTGFSGPTFTVPVPAGRYAVTGDVSIDDQDQQVVAQTGDLDVEITADTTVELDGSAAVPLVPTVEGVDTAPPMYSSSALAVTPRAGTDGYAVVTEAYAWHPSPPVHVVPMEGDAEHFATAQMFRLQAPHLAVEAGGEALAVTDTATGVPVPAGEESYDVLDAGDGADLSGAEGRLVVVDLPADRPARADISRRAAEAGAALLAFVAEGRTYVTLHATDPFDPWGDVPILAAGRDGATGLRAAAAAGEPVTVGVTASPYVYDIVTPATDRLDPEPVIDEDEQAELATLDERFHRDPDGVGATADRRYALHNLMNLDSAGPLPERRTAHVTPGILWQSMAMGPTIGTDPFTGERAEIEAAVSMDEGRTYEAGGEYAVRYASRPQWPGPVGDVGRGASACQPTPVARTADRLQVWLAAVQDRLDGFGCADPLAGEMTLERDGEPVPEIEEPEPFIAFGLFPVPAEAADYTLTYRQDEAQAPYPHRSATTWTFRSEAPDAGATAPIPLLVVGYDLGLDTQNRPTGDTATLTVRQMTGAEQSAVRRVRAWTSTDDGATWRPARVRPRRGDGYELRLPRVPAGTGVSLRVEALDAAGATVDQTLYDAYTA